MNSKIRKTRISGILSLMLVLMLAFSMMCSAITPVAAIDGSANEKVTSVSDSLMQIRMVYKDDKVTLHIPAGTCFLINENTVLTSAHVVDMNDDRLDYIKSKTTNYNKNNVSYEVVVSDDVTIPATLKKESKVNDFAIVNLNETIGNKTPAVFGDSESVIPTTNVYALGFPDGVAMVQNKNTYTSADATITTGQVSKIGEFGGIDCIQHSATMGAGNSGGPLVDENGYVLGINRGGYGGSDSDKYLYSVRIQQVMDILDALVIPYTKADAEPVEETTVEAETSAVPAQITTDAPTEPATEKPEEPAPMDTTKLIIIIAIVVLLIVLAAIIIFVIVGNKKKSSAKIQSHQRGGTVIPGAPQQPQMPSGRPSNSPYAPPQQNRPMPTMNGSAPTMPSNEGAGETSVLNDGAGETTVLGKQSTGFFIVRKNNGEKINVNKPEFVIGKERRRVDYCISDNNSVSRAHAKIRVRAGRCYISDLGSTNCTFVNGSKLSPNQEVILSKGDKIKISDEEFEFLG